MREIVSTTACGMKETRDSSKNKRILQDFFFQPPQIQLILLRVNHDILRLSQFTVQCNIIGVQIHPAQKNIQKNRRKTKFFFPPKKFGNVNVLDQRNILANEKLKDKYITGKTWTLSFMVTCIQTRFALQASSVKTEMMANVSKHLSVYRASVLEGY